MVQYVRAPKTPQPRFVEPMQCQRVSRLPSGDDWWYEIKHDGYRIISVISGQNVILHSFSALDYTDRFPAIAFALRQLKVGNAVLDGEIIALDESGRANFQELQNYRHTRLPIIYYVFDILHLAGRNLVPVTQQERREHLDSLANRVQDPIRLNPVFNVELSVFVDQVKRLGLEGIVAKRRSARYQPGKVSDDWQKHRFGKEDEFTIGGYIPGREGFSELIIGRYEDSRLMFIKRLITGFVPHTRAEVFRAIEPLRTSACPFANLPESPRSKHALTAERMNECVWVRPERQVEVEFVEWTKGGHLRHPKFRRLVG